MNSGELLTRITIWLALAGYAIGAAVYLLSRGRRRWDVVARAAWTAGCTGLLVHLVCAYHFYYDWSQAVAYRETARQTAEVTGIDWGGGLFIGYALITGWAIDVARWWRSMDAYRSRPWRSVAVWQGFLIFIIFNATVVFKTGPLRWIGLGLCLGLAFLLLLVKWSKTLRRPALSSKSCRLIERSETDVLVEADLFAALRAAAQGPDRAGDGRGDTLSPANARAGEDRARDGAGGSGARGAAALR